jgi:hypothetical protein
LGAAADVTVERWALSPAALWAGILAGPVAWAIDLEVSYALVTWTCQTRQTGILHLVTLAALALTGVGAMLSWVALGQTRSAGPTDGGQPAQRARFMAVLGLSSSVLFAITIVAGGIPRWILDACH